MKEQCERIVLSVDRDCGRPIDTLALLNEITAYIEQRGWHLVDGKQPYLVRDIVIDLVAGNATMYLAPND